MDVRLRHNNLETLTDPMTRAPAAVAVAASSPDYSGAPNSHLNSFYWISLFLGLALQVVLATNCLDYHIQVSHTLFL